MIARASSGSRSSISSVEPLMSANNAVTVLRSPSIASEVCRSGAMRTPPVTSAADGLPLSATASVPSALPQSAQNFAPSALSELQFEQRFDSGLPHSAQNFLPGIPSVPHFEQRILRSPLIEQSLGTLQIDGVETFGEPTIDFREHRARLVALTPLVEQPREACRRAQLPRFGFLTPRDLDRPPKALLGFCSDLRTGDRAARERQYSLEAMKFGLNTSLAGSFRSSQRFRYCRKPVFHPPKSDAPIGERRTVTGLRQLRTVGAHRGEAFVQLRDALSSLTADNQRRTPEANPKRRH